MDLAAIEEYVAGLRQEFADAYETQRVACETAVLVMRRLALAEALLDTYTTEPPPLLPTELVPPPQRDLAAPAATKDPGPGSSTVVDYEAVAEVVRTAMTLRRPVSVAIMETFGVSRTHATTLIDRCKAQGLLPRDLRTSRADESSPAPKQPSKQPDRPCPECGKVCAGGTGLAAHMRHAHGTPAGGSKGDGGGKPRSHHAGGAIPFVRPAPAVVADLEQAADLS